MVVTEKRHTKKYGSESSAAVIRVHLISSRGKSSRYFPTSPVREPTSSKHALALVVWGLSREEGLLPSKASSLALESKYLCGSRETSLVHRLALAKKGTTHYSMRHSPSATRPIYQVLRNLLQGPPLCSTWYNNDQTITTEMYKPPGSAGIVSSPCRRRRRRELAERHQPAESGHRTT